MTIRDTYLQGVDLASARTVTVPVAQPDEVVQVAERAVADVEAAEKPRRVLHSEIPGIPDDSWTDFVLAMKTAQPGSISASNAYGMFEIKPKRLADLGLIKNVKCKRSTSGRMVWTGEFVSPHTLKSFLKSPKLQYETFCKSMQLYVKGLADGSIPRPEGGLPEELTLSGVLAILHRAGPKGFAKWNDEASRFEDTVALVNKTNGIF